MAYGLGVDIGTTFTAAAVSRDGRAEMVNLSAGAHSAPSVVFLREDGSYVIGETAEARGASAPTRVARAFKRRIGDPAPIMLGDSPIAADQLTATILGWVRESVERVQGGPPSAVVLTHPANWGSYKTDILERAAVEAGLGSHWLLPEPAAAALHYATTDRLEPGATIAVYDLGGGTFDAAVLRRTAEGFELVGESQGIDRLGGIDIDAAVWGLATRDVELPVDEADPDVRADLADLRRACVDAKIALSTDTDATVRVRVGDVNETVRITRGQFEDAIRPTLAPSMGALERALASAGVGAGDLEKVLLVGGSSRIPLVGQMVSETLGRPVAVDADPKNSVALGAAFASTHPQASTVSTRTAHGDPGAVTASPAPPQRQGTASTSAQTVPPHPEPQVAPVSAREADAGRPAWLVPGLAAAVAALAVILGFVVFSGGDGGDPPPNEAAAPTATAPPGDAGGGAPEPTAEVLPTATAQPTPTLPPAPTPTEVSTGAAAAFRDVSPPISEWDVIFVEGWFDGTNGWLEDVTFDENGTQGFALDAGSYIIELQGNLGGGSYFSFPDFQVDVSRPALIELDVRAVDPLDFAACSISVLFGDGSSLFAGLSRANNSGGLSYFGEFGPEVLASGNVPPPDGREDTLSLLIEDGRIRYLAGGTVFEANDERLEDLPIQRVGVAAQFESAIRCEFQELRISTP